MLPTHSPCFAQQREEETGVGTKGAGRCRARPTVQFLPQPQNLPHAPILGRPSRGDLKHDFKYQNEGETRTRQELWSNSYNS